MTKTQRIVGLTIALSAISAFAFPGAKPLPASERYADYTVTTGFGSTSIIIEDNGQVIAETFTNGHEMPDTVDDHLAEYLTCGDLALLRQEVDQSVSLPLTSVPDQFDWNPVSGSSYHVYSVEGKQYELKRWGGRTAGYAVLNKSAPATAVINLLDGLYQKYFPAN